VPIPEISLVRAVRILEEHGRVITDDEADSSTLKIEVEVAEETNSSFCRENVKE
jgi:hypothetical protein